MRSIRTLVRHRPRRLALLLFLALSLPMAGSAWWLTDRYMTTRIDDYVHSVRERVEREVHTLEVEWNRSLAYLHGIPTALAEVSLLQTALTEPQGADTARLNQFLKQYVDQIGLAMAFILDKQGLCISASNAGSPLSPVGYPFPDRLYFTQAIRNGTGVQFAKGRRSQTPGLYMAHTVQRAGQPVGVAVVKADISSLLSLGDSNQTLVVDADGVVVLTSSFEYFNHALADAKARHLPPSERIARYDRLMLPLLPLSGPDEDGLYRFQAFANPVHLIRSQRLTADVEILRITELRHLPTLEFERTLMRWSVPALAVLLLWSLLTSGISLWRNRINERALAIVNQRLAKANEELQEQAMYDHLTHVANRRLFRASLDLELMRQPRHQRPLTLALMDLDHFKQINDTYGHDAGDEVLVQFTQRMSQWIRQGDLLARLGGEEFALILPDTPLNVAQHILERLCVKLAEAVTLHQGQAISVTVSIGATEAGEGDSAESLLRRADQATYVAKRNGRNRVVVSPAPTLPPPTRSVSA